MRYCCFTFLFKSIWSLNIINIKQLYKKEERQFPWKKKSIALHSLKFRMQIKPKYQKKIDKSFCRNFHEFAIRISQKRESYEFLFALLCCWQRMDELHSKVRCRSYTLERKPWTPEEKLSALVLEWWESLLMYNLVSGFQHGMWDLCRKSGRRGGTLKRKTLRLWKDVVFIFAVWWKRQRTKMIGDGFKFLCSVGWVEVVWV